MHFTFANLKGYPCGHALAIILGQHKEIKDYVKPCFTLDSFRNTYAGAIIHPHNIDFAMHIQFNPHQFNEPISDDEPVSEAEPQRTLPPNTRHQPGRPRKRRIRTATENAEDEGAKRTRVQKCGRCREEGHSARTCKEKI
jgi:hypothetical protein